MPKKYKKSVVKTQKLKPLPTIAPPMPKGSQLKKIVKKSMIKKQAIVRPTLNIPKKQIFKQKHIQKITPKPKVKSIPKKPYITLKKEIKKVKEKNPMSWLYEDKSTDEIKIKQTKRSNGSSINQDIKKLYGSEFGKLSVAQQEYILDNQEIMRRITQQVLTRVARVNVSRGLNVNRNNIIEFYLHPNGDMSDFKFLSKSGFYILDDTTKETIEYAYSRYPRPKEKTLIRYNVFYNLAY